jgi:hypothetical protein
MSDPSMSDRTDETRPPQNPERTTGWEKADSVAHAAGQVAHGIGWVFTKIYGVILVILGIVGLVAIDSPVRLLGLLVIAYGIYLLAPGSKWVIY